MSRHWRWCLAGALTLLVSLACLWNQRPGTMSLGASSTVLAANNAERWYRGNLHTHSLWSDGDEYLEMIAVWYRDQKYDFLCFTDHNLLQRTERWIDVEKSPGKRLAYDKLRTRFPENWIEDRMREGRLEVKLKTFAEVDQRIAEPGKYLLIQGQEITDKFQKKPIHMNATNVQELVPPLGGNSVYEVMQNNTNAVIAQRERTGQPILVHVNHPNFVWGITAEELAKVRGENFFEVYNGHPGVNNKGDEVHTDTDRVWDIILAKRLTELDLPVMYAIATDDGHNYHQIPSRKAEPGRGWVMVLASELTPGSLIENLEKGRFYASSGVALNRVVSDEKGLTVDVEGAPDVEYTIEFIGTRAGFDPKSTPVLDKDGNELNVTRRYSEDIGRVLAKSSGTSASYQFTGDELYVRARITSSKLHPNPSAVGDFEQAWVQPALGPAAKKVKSGE
ncbi:MAG: hypothetical protein V4719_08310 [Planctomycetota bacterium]